jgi:hypothetical protein
MSRTVFLVVVSLVPGLTEKAFVCNRSIISESRSDDDTGHASTGMCFMAATF